jgi:hypothetical protein
MGPHCPGDGTGWLRASADFLAQKISPELLLIYHITRSFRLEIAIPRDPRLFGDLHAHPGIELRRGVDAEAAGAFGRAVMAEPSLTGLC